VFGEEGARRLLISSTKSMTGHTLGAAGGIEAIVAAKALSSNEVPPTMNLEFPDPDCDLNYCPNKKVIPASRMKATLSTTLGFGGHNAVLVIREYKG